MTVYPINVLSDNIIWVIVDDTQTHCLLIDMGQAASCIEFLKKMNLSPEAILLTHHHWDHTQDVDAFKEVYPGTVVVGSPRDEMPHIDLIAQPNEKLHFSKTGLTFNTLHTPGHTKDAMCYYTEDMIFTGDTLFAAGCGRLFEGTPEQMHQSLWDICALPDQTKIYCGHEYTASNLKFALHLDPNHDETLNWAKEIKGLDCTLPSTIAQEKACNPFVRASDPAYAKLISQKTGKKVTAGIECLGVLRAMKDGF